MLDEPEVERQALGDAFGGLRSKDGQHMTRTLQAIAHARRIEPVVRAAYLVGATTHRALAAALNRKGILTATGKRWTARSARVLYWRVQPPRTQEEIDFLRSADRLTGRRLSPEERWRWLEQAKSIGDLDENPLDWRRDMREPPARPPALGVRAHAEGRYQPR